MRRIRVALAQLNVRVGDLDGNVGKIIDAYDAAVEGGADVVVYGELTVTGYPPEDLLHKPRFIARYSNRARTVRLAVCGVCV